MRLLLRSYYDFMYYIYLCVYVCVLATVFGASKTKSSRPPLYHHPLPLRRTSASSKSLPLLNPFRGPWMHICNFKRYIQDLFLVPVINKSNIYLNQLEHCHNYIIKCSYLKETTTTKKSCQPNTIRVRDAGSQRVNNKTHISICV